MMTAMRLNELQKQLAPLMTREDTLPRLARCADAGAVSALFAAEGVQITAEEVNELTAYGNSLIRAEGEKEELNEDDLVIVAGGGKILRGIASVAGAVGLGAALGIVSGAFPAFTPVAYKIGVGYAVATSLWICAA